MDLDDFNRPAPNIPIVLDEETVDFVVPAAVPAKLEWLRFTSSFRFYQASYVSRPYIL